jgi:hypothetical protein
MGNAIGRGSGSRPFANGPRGPSDPAPSGSPLPLRARDQQLPSPCARARPAKSANCGPQCGPTTTPLVGEIAGRWREGRDSNPGAPHGASGFQDRRLRPLGHPPAANLPAGNLSARERHGLGCRRVAANAHPPRNRIRSWPGSSPKPINARNSAASGGQARRIGVRLVPAVGAMYPDIHIHADELEPLVRRSAREPWSTSFPRERRTFGGERGGRRG